MFLILLVVLGAGAGWALAQQGVLRLKPEVAAIAGGVGAIAGAAIMTLLSAIGSVIGALLGIGLALWLAQSAFQK